MLFHDKRMKFSEAERQGWQIIDTYERIVSKTRRIGRNFGGEDGECEESSLVIDPQGEDSSRSGRTMSRTRGDRWFYLVGPPPKY